MIRCQILSSRLLKRWINWIIKCGSKNYGCHVGAIHSTNINIEKLMGGSNLKEKITCQGPMASLETGWKGIWDWDICCGTVVRPTTPLMSCGISSCGRTTSCWAEAVDGPWGGHHNWSNNRRSTGTHHQRFSSSRRPLCDMKHYKEEKK